VTNQTDQIKDAPKSEPAPLRSITEIVADLSRTINAQRLRQRKQGGKEIDYLPWYEAVHYLDHYAPGWSYEIRSVSQIGENLVMTVRVSITCLEGVIWRDASSLEKIEDPKRYGDAATNAESAALRRAASKFGLALYLYDKD